MPGSDVIDRVSEPAQTMTIVVHFPNVLTPQGERDVREAVSDFKASLYLGTVVKAELVKVNQ